MKIKNGEYFADTAFKGTGDADWTTGGLDFS